MRECRFCRNKVEASERSLQWWAIVCVQCCAVVEICRRWDASRQRVVELMRDAGDGHRVDRLHVQSYIGDRAVGPGVSYVYLRFEDTSLTYPDLPRDELEELARRHMTMHLQYWLLPSSPRVDRKAGFVQGAPTVYWIGDAIEDLGFYDDEGKVLVDKVAIDLGYAAIYDYVLMCPKGRVAIEISKYLLTYPEQQHYASLVLANDSPMQHAWRYIQFFQKFRVGPIGNRTYAIYPADGSVCLGAGGGATSVLYTQRVYEGEL